MSATIPLVTRLSSRVIRILGCNPGLFTLQGTNTYLIGKGPSRTLLDVGEPNNSKYLSLLKEVLDSNNVSITNVIISHWHFDHVGGLKDFINLFKPKDCKFYKIKCSEHDSEEIKFDYLEDGQELCVDSSSTLKVLHTPGHSTDHACILLKEDNTLFSGDCILGEGSCVFEDLWSYMKSLERLLSINSSVIYPGHGPEVLNPNAKINEYINHRNERERSILECLPKQQSEAISIDSIVKKIYKDTPESKHFVASVLVGHHLDKLLKEGKVERLEHSYSHHYWAR